MTAFQAALFQVYAAATVLGVCLAYVAYVTGVADGIRRAMIGTIQITCAVALSTLPTPKPIKRARHALKGK
jgi:hypothetical protein